MMIKLLRQPQLLLVAVVVWMILLLLGSMEVNGLSSLRQTASHPYPPHSPPSASTTAKLSPTNGHISTTSTTATAATSRRGFIMNHVFAVTGAVGVASTTFAYHPQPTWAYPRRDVGVEGERSGITEAFNEQAYKTNNRLEASGFPIDSVEQEQQRLDNAISTFSYEEITGSSGSSSKNKKQSKSKATATSSKSDSK